MAINHNQVEGIFNAAVAMGSSAERAGYLDISCGHDSHLRERVEALLASHDAPGTLLGLPSDGALEPGSGPFQGQ